MIEFYPPKLTDKLWVDKLLTKADYYGCEYNFTNLYTWRKAYCHEIAQVDNTLVARLCGGLGLSYLYPAGTGDLRGVVRLLAQEAEAAGEELRLVCLTPEQMEELEQFFPGQFTFQADRDGHDYLYDIDRLADLKGKKLHSKRNHINALEKQFPDWSYEEMTTAMLPECLAMDKEWYRRSREREGIGEEQDLGNEGVALREAMEHFEVLGLEGGVLRIHGEVVAFTLGDKLGEQVYDVHFEKAYNELRGAYPLINREFARQVRGKHPEIRFLNREDDMGVPGLRKAKQSYYPDRMVEKNSAILKKGEQL